VRNNATIFTHNLSDLKHFRASDSLNFVNIVGCKLFELRWLQCFEIDKLDQNGHFAVPRLVHDPLHRLVFKNNRHSTPLFNKPECVLDEAFPYRRSV
jgi:hypothetical protein